jgi:hypothetical protein
MTSPPIDGVDAMYWSAGGAFHGAGPTVGNGEQRIESHMILRARCHHGIGPLFWPVPTIRAMRFGDV